MLHVAVIGLRGIPDVMGGIESHCAHLLPRMIAAAPAGQLKITVLGRSRYVPKKARYRGVDQIALWAPAHPALETILHTGLAICHARFVLRADCIHLHGIGPGLMAPLAWLFGLPILFTHHGEDYRRKKWGKLSRIALRVGEMLAVKCARRVVTVSRSSARQLRHRFPARAARIVHIPNGLPPAEPPDRIPELPPVAAPVAAKVSPGQYIISVGRLVPEKGHDVLIDAYRNTGLSGQNPPIGLLIVGAADHESGYAARLRARAGDGVTFAGQLGRDEVMALNRNAALFVLPSYHEGLSIAALEALQADTPILLSDIEANRDIGLPAHHYFATGSANALARKLNQPPQAFSAPADFDTDAFNWDRIANQTLHQLALIQYRGKPLVSWPIATEADHV